ncbi:MAG: adenylate/guanylate cyclase domain-containing protein, partial [Runella zeae]
VNFTRMAGGMSSIELVDLLDRLFSNFDAVSEYYGVTKVKTIGDCYVAAVGLDTSEQQYAAGTQSPATALLALIEAALNYIQIAKSLQLQVRVGISTGAVISGITGRKV